jgi:hypothetical protein
MLATRWKNLVFGYWMFPASGEMNWPDLAFNLVHGPHPIVEMYVFSCSVRKKTIPFAHYLSLRSKQDRFCRHRGWLLAVLLTLLGVSFRFVSFTAAEVRLAPLLTTV